MGVLSFDSRQTISGTNLCVNTWHVYTSGQPLVSEMNALLVPFNTFFNSIGSMRPGTSSVVTGTRVLYFLEAWWTKPVGKPGTPGYVKGFFNTPPFIQGCTPVTSAAGTGTGTTPPQLASVVSWRTAISGRSGRGRTYLGNLAASAMINSTLTAAAVTAINNAASALISAVGAITSSGANAALSVWSPTRGNLTPILSGASDSTFDTMRSRVK